MPKKKKAEEEPMGTKLRVVVWFGVCVGCPCLHEDKSVCARIHVCIALDHLLQ